MEDTKETTSTAPVAVEGGVMDVKPPSSSDASAVDVRVETGASTETAPVVTEEPVTAADTISDESEAPVGDATPTKGTEPDPKSEPGNDNPMAIPPAPAGTHKGAPKAAIVVAVIIALALAALTVFAYMKTKNDSKQSVNDRASSSVTASDVDQASKDLDTSLNKADDTKDFPESDLTDQNLGL